MTEAPPRYFTSDYVEHATLRDGTPVVLRLVAPEDKALIEEGFKRLSPESRYTRFLSPKTTLTEHELKYLTEIDHENHFAIGALREDGDGHGNPIGLGIARFIKLADPPGTAEAAIAVADDVQGRGLGRLLFQRLCAAAIERGVERFRCVVLGSNTAMRQMIEAITPEHSTEVSSGVITIDMMIPHVAPDAPATGPIPEGPMYKLFRAAAENAVEWTDAFRRLLHRE